MFSTDQEQATKGTCHSRVRAAMISHNHAISVLNVLAGSCNLQERDRCNLSLRRLKDNFYSNVLQAQSPPQGGINHVHTSLKLAKLISSTPL